MMKLKMIVCAGALGLAAACGVAVDETPIGSGEMGTVESAAISPAVQDACGTGSVCFDFDGGNKNLTHVGVEGAHCGSGAVQVQIDGGAWTAATGNSIRQNCPIANQASLVQFGAPNSPGHHRVCFSNIDPVRVHARIASKGCESEDVAGTCPSCATGAGGSGGVGGAGGTGGEGSVGGSGGTDDGDACIADGPLELNRCFTDTGINPWGHYVFNPGTGRGHYLQGGTLADAGAAHPANRNNPDHAVGGGPGGNHFNLGVGGWIKLGFPVLVPDGPGHDLQVLGAPGSICDSTAAIADVYVAGEGDGVSADASWVLLGEACGAVTKLDLSCLAGDPAAAQLLQTGVRFVKIEDRTETKRTAIEAANLDSPGFVLDLVGGLTCP